MDTTQPYAKLGNRQHYAKSPSGPNRWGDLTKRLFDIVVSSIGLLLLFPFFIIIGILLKCDTPGPIFYRGPRVGRNGKNFGILKFRTMYEDPESYQGAKVTAWDDPRITPLGRWLRSSKVNELPQLWNVLIGDMSMVGPRPEDPDIAADWPEAVRREVLSVRPGITSPASVVYRDEESMLGNSQVMHTYVESILPSKLRLDQLYVRHRSFWLDLDILFWTFLVLIPNHGTDSPLEEHLFLGPVTRLIRRYVSWFVIDTLVTFIAMGIAGILWRSFGPLDIGWPLAIGIAFGFALLFSATGALLGVNKISWANTGAADVLDLVPSFLIATAAALLVNRVWFRPPLLPAGMVLTASILSFTGFVLVRYRSRLIAGMAQRWLSLRGEAAEAKEQVLIVGCGEAGKFMSWLLNGSTAQAFHLVGFIDDDLYKQGTRIQGVNVLGRRNDIPEIVTKCDIGIIVFAIHNIDPQDRDQVLEICRSTPARVIILPNIIGVMTSLVTNGHTPMDTESLLSQPVVHMSCEHCMNYLSPLRFDRWLTDLQALAQDGDLTAVSNQVKSLQREIRAYSFQTEITAAQFENQAVPAGEK